MIHDSEIPCVASEIEVETTAEVHTAAEALDSRNDHLQEETYGGTNWTRLIKYNFSRPEHSFLSWNYPKYVVITMYD